MHIIDQRLKERTEKNDPIKIAIIGCGEMGKGIINQISRYTDGIKVVIAYNRTLSKVVEAFNVANITKFVSTNDDKEIAENLKKGVCIATQNLEHAIHSEYVDCIVEATGQIGFAADVILRSFKAGKHVVTINAELDGTFGWLLREKAKQYNVRYTLGDGDQPGVTLNLFRYVKSIGLNPLMCGNIKGLQDRYRTPATQENFAKGWGITPKMASCFADGTKISFEQACTANATNFTVAKRGMIGFETSKHVDDFAKDIDVDMLKEKGGIVDYVLGAKPAPGVFVYATANDPLTVKYLNYGKLGEGPLYSFYIPYHLLFIEFVLSIPRLTDFNDVTIDAAYGMKVEVGTFAKHNVKAGTQLDGLGGFHAYGLCENYAEFNTDRLLPIGLSESTVLKRDIKKDAPITFDDVEFTNDYELSLFKEQEELLKT